MSYEGLVLVDKPSGPTSHDVVAMARKIFGTRKVGHAGTLDPMASGMLVLGIGRATRLLGHLAMSDKEYMATIRLGESTDTDDAQGEVTARHDAGGVSRDDLIVAARAFRGAISQRPSSVSAIKVDGKRAYARVRAGETVELQARTVTVTDLEILGVRHTGAVVDVDVRVVCSAGTYIRAIARDLGEALGVGGHLTSLRRTRSGSFSAMVPLDELRERPSCLSLADSVRVAFPQVVLDDVEATRARHGVRVPAPPNVPTGTVGVFDAGGSVISLAQARDALLVPAVVFVDE